MTFVAFDILWLDGELVTRRPYAERRALLEGLGLPALGVPVMPTYRVGRRPGPVPGLRGRRGRRHRPEAVVGALPARPAHHGVAEGQVLGVVGASGAAAAGVTVQSCGRSTTASVRPWASCQG